MSKKSNRIVTFWKIVESKIRRTAFIRRGKALSIRNNTIVQDSLCLLSLCWHDLLTFGNYPFHRDLCAWLDKLCAYDFYDLVVCFKSADRLLHDLSITDYEGFKHSLKQTCPSSGAVIAPLKGFIAQWTESKSTSAFSQLHQAFCFISQLNLYDLSDLNAEALQDYEKNESLLEFVIPTTEEASIISSWFPRSTIPVIMDNFRPKHGSGAVADSASCLADKYKHMGNDCLLHYINNKVGWTEADFPRPMITLNRVSKVVFVPKSALKLRTICTEPAALQWYQQGFLHSIRRYINYHPYLKKRIDLSKQELNQDLAWEGSINGDFSTIDLSAASDSVSWRLVKDWFNDSSLREVLTCTRSKKSQLPDGTIVELRKFAPMGSALCFPVECIVFCAIIEAAIREIGGSCTQSKYRVYGDDLIIETRFVQAVIGRLTRNGFRVNLDKSFTASDSPIFRESCGGEFLDGENVTPIKLSRQFDGLAMTGRYIPSRMLSCIDLCNRCYTRLPSVRRYILSKVNTLQAEYRVLFCDDGERGVFSTHPSNHHLMLSHYYHTDYQCEYVKHGGIAIKQCPPEIADEDIRLFEWLRSTQARTTFNYDVDTRVSILPPKSATWGRKASPL